MKTRGAPFAIARAMSSSWYTRSDHRITCRELIATLGRYINGELPPAERDELDRHIADCPDCRSYLESYRQTIRLARGAAASAEGALPGSIPEDLVRAVLAARKKARPRDA